MLALRSITSSPVPVPTLDSTKESPVAAVPWIILYAGGTREAVTLELVVNEEVGEGSDELVDDNEGDAVDESRPLGDALRDAKEAVAKEEAVMEEVEEVEAEGGRRMSQRQSQRGLMKAQQNQSQMVNR